MAKVKRVDHVAVLVEDLDKPLSFWRDSLGLEGARVKEIPEENARIAFLPIGDDLVELVMPTNADSGIAKYLQKHGPGMHHICLEVDDIDGMLVKLKDAGVPLVNETARTGVGGKKYAFIHPKGAYGVLVELYEIPE